MAYDWQYYDLVLFGIALSMSVGAGVGYLTSISLSVAIISAGLVACAIIGHGLFINGPVDEPQDLTNEVEALN
ncbi:hypothetical protein SAMN05421858_2031 [Haladaptatus litoreus]|uniref:Uncharacterized protein n=1 Tax=Haladaptatus litoreus TaxID=553468 RepID=A0A1N6ZHJ6_9EURY|nr:hypothetical protein SAMN05421858_2031 [Haladaptatus litoreus]